MFHSQLPDGQVLRQAPQGRGQAESCPGQARIQVFVVPSL